MKKIFVFLLFCGLFMAQTNAQKVIYITTQQFKEKVFDFTKGKEAKYLGSKPCIVDFYASWCGPCKRLAPIMEEIAAEYADDIIVYKLDIDQERDVARAFGVSSIPQLFFFPTKGMIRVSQGLVPKETIEEAIQTVFFSE